MEQLATFTQLDNWQWLVLQACNFTPRQLAGCGSLGSAGLFDTGLQMKDLRQLQVRTATAEKFLAYLADGSKVNAFIEATENWMNSRPNCTLVHCCHAGYPQSLLQANSPPLLIYVQGNSKLLNVPSVAMVGARNPTPQGIENAGWFARTLATAGISVVSGLASGIDAASHIAALQGGVTMAVMGTGLDTI